MTAQFWKETNQGLEQLVLIYSNIYIYTAGKRYLGCGFSVCFYNTKLLTKLYDASRIGWEAAYLSHWKF